MGCVTLPLYKLESSKFGRVVVDIEQGTAKKYKSYGKLELSWKFSKCNLIECKYLAHRSPNAETEGQSERATPERPLRPVGGNDSDNEADPVVAVLPSKDTLELISSLCSEAWKGDDLETFRKILSQLEPGQVNQKNSRGQTALYCAARNGNTNFVLELLKQPLINMEIAEPTVGSSPLHAAGFYHHADIVALLIFNGANIHVKNKAPVPVSARDEAQGAAFDVYSTFENYGKEGLKSRWPICASLEPQAKEKKNKRLSSPSLHQPPWAESTDSPENIGGLAFAFEEATPTTPRWSNARPARTIPPNHLEAETLWEAKKPSPRAGPGQSTSPSSRGPGQSTSPDRYESPRSPITIGNSSGSNPIARIAAEISSEGVIPPRGSPRDQQGGMSTASASPAGPRANARAPLTYPPQKMANLPTPNQPVTSLPFGFFSPDPTPKRQPQALPITSPISLPSATKPTKPAGTNFSPPSATQQSPHAGQQFQIYTPQPFQIATSLLGASQQPINAPLPNTQPTLSAPAPILLPPSPQPRRTVPNLLATPLETTKLPTGPPPAPAPVPSPEPPKPTGPAIPFSLPFFSKTEGESSETIPKELQTSIQTGHLSPRGRRAQPGVATPTPTTAQHHLNQFGRAGLVTTRSGVASPSPQQRIAPLNQSYLQTEPKLTTPPVPFSLQLFPKSENELLSKEPIPQSLYQYTQTLGRISNPKAELKASNERKIVPPLSKSHSVDSKPTIAPPIAPPIPFSLPILSKQETGEALDSQPQPSTMTTQNFPTRISGSKTTLSTSQTPSPSQTPPQRPSNPGTNPKAADSSPLCDLKPNTILPNPQTCSQDPKAALLASQPFRPENQVPNASSFSQPNPRVYHQSRYAQAPSTTGLKAALPGLSTTRSQTQPRPPLKKTETSLPQRNDVNSNSTQTVTQPQDGLLRSESFPLSNHNRVDDNATTSTSRVRRIQRSATGGARVQPRHFGDLEQNGGPKHGGRS